MINLLGLEGISMIPNWDCYCFLSFLLATPLFRILERLFQLTLRPSRTLNLAFCIASGTSGIRLQALAFATSNRSKDNVEKQTLKVCLNKKLLFTLFLHWPLIVKSQQSSMEVSDQTWDPCSRRRPPWDWARLFCPCTRLKSRHLSSGSVGICLPSGGSRREPDPQE